jgi:hypothetical protein
MHWNHLLTVKTHRLTPMLSFGPSILNTRVFNMKIIHSILNFIQSLREANYAANLARNGKIKEAQDCYADKPGICRGL